MPFDMTPQVETDKHRIYKRLCILRELLPKSSDQGSYHTCLWSVARDNSDLLALGISGDIEPTDIDKTLFGPIGTAVFSNAGKVHKAVVLDETIKAMERELVTV